MATMDKNVLASCEYDREFVPTSVDSVICPKPRRLGSYGGTCFHWHTNNHLAISDIRVGTELLDMIHAKGSCHMEGPDDKVASSLPFSYGSPPSRVSNPVVQDEHFGTWRFIPSSPVTAIPTSPPSSARKGGCAHTQLGQKSVTLRIEGFNCLSRDRQQNCGISAVA